MIGHTLLLALRQLSRNRLFSVLTIGGLVIAVAGAILVGRYCLYQLSFDRHHPGSHALYRVGTESYNDGVLQSRSAITPGPLYDALKAELPPAAAGTRLLTTSGWFDCALAYNNGIELKIFNQRHLYYADELFFSTFAYSFIAGDPSTALLQPYSIVLAESEARRYFGEEPALGKILHLKGSGDEHDYTVTAIISDPAGNTHLDGTVFLSASSTVDNENFLFADAYTYVKLPAEENLAILEKAFPKINAQVFDPLPGTTQRLFAQPVRDIHLQAGVADNPSATGSSTEVFLLLTVAAIILGLAWLNYISLAIARVFQRTREIGIRKVNGAGTSHIYLQFGMEAIVMNVAAFAIAFAGVALFEDTFYSFTSLNFVTESHPISTAWPGILATMTILLAGSTASALIPAHVLAAVRPVSTLQGTTAARFKGTFQRITVVVQFAAVTGLLACVYAFFTQFEYIRTRDRAVDASNAMILRSPVNVDSSYRSRFGAFAGELRSRSIVRAISTSTSVPGQTISWTGAVRGNSTRNVVDFAIAVIDPDFLNAYGLDLAAGRNFSEGDYPVDEQFGKKREPVILNRTGAAMLGFANPEDAEGQHIFWGENRCIITGVVNDFNQESLHHPIRPMLFTANTGPTLTLQLMPGARASAIDEVRQAWNKHFPSNPFDYSFLADDYKLEYRNDERLSRLLQFFCVVAVAIASMGLFALALFSSTRRLKEIGIRKIFGASGPELFRLLTVEYVLLVGCAAGLSLPAAHYIAHQWLEGFAYRTKVGLAFYVLPVLLSAAIALVTVTFQILRVVRQEPRKTLRHE